MITIQKLKDNWPMYLVFIAANLIALWIGGCPPKTESIQDPPKRITRPELQLELDTIMAKAQIAMVDLDRQDELRQVILQNALLIVQGTPLNPVGILTGIAALYGIGSAATATKRRIGEKLKNSKSS